MSLLTSLYNKVAGFFRTQEDIDASKAVAANRLKLVLMQDRTNLTPKVLEQMRGELVDLLSKYLEMDKDLLELNFEQEGDQVALMLSIPVIRAKDEEEIEEALQAASSKEHSDETDSEGEDEAEDDFEVNADSENNPFAEHEIEVEANSETETETGEDSTENVEEETSKAKKRPRKLKKFTSPEGLESNNESYIETESEEEYENSEA